MPRYFRRFQHFIPPPEAAAINAEEAAVICNQDLGDAAAGGTSRPVVPS